MRDIVHTLLEWSAAGHEFAVATVIRVRGSAPRDPGASLAVRADGVVAGSLSGGCVESAVCTLAGEVLERGEPAREWYGFDPGDPFAVGLTCGGELEVFVRAFPAGAQSALVAAAERDESVALVRTLDGTAVTAVFEHSTVGDALDRSIVDSARNMLGSGETGILEHGGQQVFVDSWVGKPRMLVFGSVDFAASVAGIGRFLGYHVVVCDARARFTTAERFPQAHEVIVDWPHRYLARTTTDRRTVVCVLTHDAKFDIPLLTEALRRELGYIGALGSRRTHAERLRRLSEEGLGPDELARLRAPIGLDLGGHTPEETAVSIAAEIIALRHGGSTAPLSTSGGPIHHEPVGIG